ELTGKKQSKNHSLYQPKNAAQENPSHTIEFSKNTHPPTPPHQKMERTSVNICCATRIRATAPA
ncbi:hypothetical protein, partial [Gordonia sp. VNK21]|uniref:hypothetical protein n=1 Tax=Gordonia sp. VNK21 TaxID=3382483 RepID=UPI0038D3FD79